MQVEARALCIHSDLLGSKSCSFRIHMGVLETLGTLEVQQNRVPDSTCGWLWETKSAQVITWTASEGSKRGWNQSRFFKTESVCLQNLIFILMDSVFPVETLLYCIFSFMQIDQTMTGVISLSYSGGFFLVCFSICPPKDSILNTSI